MSELKLRRYRESDREAVQELHVLGLQQMGAALEPGPWDDDVRNIVEHYYQNDGEFLLAEYEGKVAAMGAFRKTGENEAEIKRMRTHPAFQRRGFGQRIYEALEQKAREKGHTRLHLETGEDNVSAQQFYIKNGYIATHHGTVHLGQASIFFEKYLTDQPAKENI